MSLMNEASIANYITKTFPGVETSTDFGYTFFFLVQIASFPLRR